MWEELKRMDADNLETQFIHGCPGVVRNKEPWKWK